jgi:hypothetical protein
MNAGFVASEIDKASRALSERGARLWERIRIQPTEWRTKQYPGEDLAWVVATVAYRCLYFNEVEGGWGWGRFSDWGNIEEHHWEQLEIHELVEQMLFGIDHGESG